MTILKPINYPKNAILKITKIGLAESSGIYNKKTPRRELF